VTLEGKTFSEEWTCFFTPLFESNQLVVEYSQIGIHLFPKCSWDYLSWFWCLRISIYTSWWKLYNWQPYLNFHENSSVGNLYIQKHVHRTPPNS